MHAREIHSALLRVPPEGARQHYSVTLNSVSFATGIPREILIAAVGTSIKPQLVGPWNIFWSASDDKLVYKETSATATLGPWKQGEKNLDDFLASYRKKAASLSTPSRAASSVTSASRPAAPARPTLAPEPSINVAEHAAAIRDRQHAARVRGLREPSCSEASAEIIDERKRARRG